ncbi:MAG: radical SAM protein [Myxococcales bacterium]
MPWLALVGPEYEENLSLRHLASALAAAGFECELVPFNRELELPAVLDAVLSRRSEPPLVVALSLAFQWRALDFLALAMGLRERGYQGHITAGGHFGTFAAAELLRDFPQLDSLCRHECEELIVELAKALEDGAPLSGIPGLATRDAQGQVVLAPLRSPPDLARLPWPDRRGEPARCLGHGIAAMVSGRGCYARCAFCCIAAWHEQTLPGKRYRLRPVEDVAREMVWLQAEKGRDIFIFHDDNFFLPRPQDSLERIHALADEIERLGMTRFATVVKARPNDVTDEVFGAMRDRLGCVRVFLGVESDSDQGLVTLGRKVASEQNHAALEVLTRLGIYVCFNLLVFDPDTTLETLEANLAFMERYGENPFNFGRVELYAGTPLLERMQRERRCTGDYLGWDYPLANPEIQKTFELAIQAFYERNFASHSLANRLMGTRFDAESARHFFPERYRPQWVEEAKALNRRLAADSVAGLREIVRFVRERGAAAPADSFVSGLGLRLRAAEKAIEADAAVLERSIRERVSKPGP